MTTVNAQITLTAGDQTNETSFNTGLHWSDSLAPSSGKDYVVDNKTLRTPSGTHTFQGDSLTITGNGSMRLDQGSSTLTINDFILNSGRVYVGAFGAFTLNGSINLTGAGRLENGSSGVNTIITVGSTISGGSLLTIAGDGTKGQKISLDATNSFTGGTSVVSFGHAVGNAAGAFGTGDVTISDNSTLTLDVTQALSSTASLILNANSVVNLDFTGGNTIVSGISLDGGSTILTDIGTYGAIGSGATYEFSQFSGTGFIAIPEPSSYGLLLGGLSVLCLLSRKRMGR